MPDWSTRRVWGRIDSLWVKLFVAIAGANALLAVMAFMIFSRSFDQGFVEYLNNADEARLLLLTEQLADGYQRQGDWQWLQQDRKLWQQLVRETFGGNRGGHDGPFEPPRPEAPRLPSGDESSRFDVPHAELPRTEPARNESRRFNVRADKPVLTIDPRLLLLDAQRQILLGRHEMLREASLKPIRVNQQLVGYLGYVPRLNMVESLEKVFSAQQNRKFAAIAAGLVLSGLLVGALLAYWLIRRIQPIAQGTASLIQGDYQARIQWQGRDELAQLAQDINRLAETLAAAQQARQQWIADIAHELRTPLSSLKAEIEALEDGVRSFGPASLNSLGQEIGQLTRLVEDLHLLSLSDLGALSYIKSPVAFDQLIAELVQSRLAQLEAAGIQLQLQLQPELYLLADASRLTQVISNLLHNTLKYTDSPGELQIRLQRQDDCLVLSWQDSSPGVADQDLQRLTDRLFRVDESRSRAAGGSGLGLAIAKAIIEAHGGHLRASHSALGGVAWHIELPASDKGGRHG